MEEKRISFMGMVSVLSRAACFIAIIFLGYFLRRSGFFKADDFQVISRIVLKITLPAAIVYSFADKVIVSEYNNTVVGFTTGKADNTQPYGHLVLSAVSDKYRGLGIYTSMIYEGIKWLEKEGFKGLIVGTQINNIAVQKAWIKLGFTVLDSEYVLHFYI